MIASVLAHQGGWDEALLVLVPVAVFVALLSMANRRAKALQKRRLEEAELAEAAEPTGRTDPDDGADR